MIRRAFRLGLPQSGPGSVATIGSRVGAFVVDAIVANLAAGIPFLFGVRYSLADRNYIVFGIFLLLEFIFSAVYGQTLGKRLFNIRVIRADGRGLGAPRWLALRVVLLGFLVPAVVWDRDRRGLHDKAAGVVVVVDPNLAARQGASGRTRQTPQPMRPSGTQPKKAPAAKRKKKR